MFDLNLVFETFMYELENFDEKVKCLRHFWMTVTEAFKKLLQINDSSLGHKICF